MVRRHVVVAATAAAGNGALWAKNRYTDFQCSLKMLFDVKNTHFHIIHKPSDKYPFHIWLFTRTRLFSTVELLSIFWWSYLTIFGTSKEFSFRLRFANAMLQFDEFLVQKALKIYHFSLPKLLAMGGSDCEMNWNHHWINEYAVWKYALHHLPCTYLYWKRMFNLTSEYRYFISISLSKHVQMVAINFSICLMQATGRIYLSNILANNAVTMRMYIYIL